MLYDITLRVTPKMVTDAQTNLKKAMVGHLGTHFDVMNKEFPLDYIKRPCVVFNVKGISGRDIEVSDVDLLKVHKGMFVAFYSGFIEEEGYGSKRYFAEHPQLSKELIDNLLNKKISMIGVDFSGVRNGKEHNPTDQYCADRGVFIVENMCNLAPLCGKENITTYTFPINFEGYTGLPCRVVVEIPDTNTV